MKLVFVCGTEVFFQNNLQEDIRFSQAIGILFFADIPLSQEYAKAVATENEAIFVIKIEDLFKKMKDNIYSFSLGDYTVHLTKIGKKIQSSLSHFPGRLPNLEEFLYETTDLTSWFFQISHTQWCLSVFLHFVSRVFWPTLIIMVLVILYLSYKIKILSIDLERKQAIYEIFFLGNK